MIKEVSIIFMFFLLIDNDVILMKICDVLIFGMILIFLNAFIKKIGEYYIRRQTQIEFDIIITKLEDELKKISGEQLRTDSSKN